MRRIAHADLGAQPEPLLAAADTAHARLIAHATHSAALTRAHADIADITLRATRAIVAQELTLAPEHVRAVVSELIQQVRKARQITLRVHPDDRALLPDARQLAEQAEAQGEFDIVDDNSLARGDCLLESDRGDLDARIETKLAQLAEQLSAGTRS